MNEDPVLIVDDDIDMEPVVILDDDDDVTIISEKAVDVATAEAIVLDEESPIVTKESLDLQSVLNNKPILSNTDTSFVNNLKNNRLMDKIVTRCITMENATGMPRVVYKTVLPLYRDANNTFKESEAFRELLKKTYKLLSRDPDHKFLHIKTLCEELKSGGLRRKVPFVTLASNLKNNGSQQSHKELTSSSRGVNQNDVVNRQTHKVDTNKQNTRKKVPGTGTQRTTRISKISAVNTKYRIKTRSVTHAEKEKTDIIDLDDSDTEPVSVDRSEKDDGKNDVIIIEETEPSVQRSDNEITVPQETESKKGNQVIQESLVADSNKKNKVVQERIEKDSNKENNDENVKLSDSEMDYELLIPESHVRVLPICEVSPSRKSNNDLDKIAHLEQQIANYKRMIDKLEEAEVTTESPNGSQYYLCSKYKENVVACYKQICEIKGNCPDIVKRCEIRLIVAEGHPPGPAKRLEEFLNSTIDRTGTVEFPDFSEVVKCVVESNLVDNLAWNRQQVIHEAVGLFRQCGQALRTRRQKREYRDLLSLVREDQETEDPADKDPILLAKLEENKHIAKMKEEEILERYVNMENNALRNVGISQIGNAVEFESDHDSSGSDSESEENISLPSNITTSTIYNQPNTGECSRTLPSNITISTSNNQPNTVESSRSNINLSQNDLILTSTFRNNHSVTGQSSITNDIIVTNLTANPMLLRLLIVPNITQDCVQGTAQGSQPGPSYDNQCATRESSIINDATSNNDSVMLPTSTRNFSPTKLTVTNSDTTHNDCETVCLNNEEIIPKSELTITETVVGYNNTMVNENSNISSINTKGNVENTEIPAGNQLRSVNDVLDNVSSTTDGIEQNCDSSIGKTGVELKSEDIKMEPLDIQSMLDELGTDYVCKVFDIEDPFLVIEISSDEDES